MAALSQPGVLSKVGSATKVSSTTIVKGAVLDGVSRVHKATPGVTGLLKKDETYIARKGWVTPLVSSGGGGSTVQGGGGISIFSGGD